MSSWIGTVTCSYRLSPWWTWSMNVLGLVSVVGVISTINFPAMALSWFWEIGVCGLSDRTVMITRDLRGAFPPVLRCAVWCAFAISERCGAARVGEAGGLFQTVQFSSTNFEVRREWARLLGCFKLSSFPRNEFPGAARVGEGYEGDGLIQQWSFPSTDFWVQKEWARGVGCFNSEVS